MLTDPELGDSILHKGGWLHYQAVDEAIKEEAALKEEARVRGEDPEQYVLMRRIAEYGEQARVPNPLAEKRMAELRAGESAEEAAEKAAEEASDEAAEEADGRRLSESAACAG
jgi:hypothetical protein